MDRRVANMKHFLTYVKHSYQIILEVEAKTNINLEQDVEAFMVHTFAKYMEQPHIPTDSIAIKMMKSVKQRGEGRKRELQQIAEECLLIDGFGLNKSRWPNSHYFKDMGVIACEYRAFSERPPELLYERIGNEFEKLSYLLNKLRTS